MGGLFRCGVGLNFGATKLPETPFFGRLRNTGSLQRKFTFGLFRLRRTAF